MPSCCKCASHSSTNARAAQASPLICLVPRIDARHSDTGGSTMPRPASASAEAQSNFQLLDEDYIKKHFKLPPRPLYLDPSKRPLITFPLGGKTNHFNMARKTQINRMILDGQLDPSEAISAPSVFPYASTSAEKQEAAEQNEEVIYLLQLPDIESRCPIHNQVIRTPRFIWHACKKSKKVDDGELKSGPGPLNRPKPWLLSRHTDFDLQSQW